MLLLNGQALAQTAADRADIARAQTPGGAEIGGPTVEINGHAVPSPNDSDLGEQAILKNEQRYQPFTALVALPFYETSNAALVRNGEQSDFLEAPVVALSYQPRLMNNLYGTIMVREQLFYYNRLTSLNFGSFDTSLGLVYTVPQWHNLILRGQFIYERLTEKNSFESFFSNYSFFLNAELPFRLDRAQQVAVGVDANISATADPEPPRRNEYEAYAGYTANVSRWFSVDATGRIVVRQYQLTDRVDVSEVFAASANINFNQYLTASAITSLAANQSNHSVYDYKVANFGGLFSLTVKF